MLRHLSPFLLFHAVLLVALFLSLTIVVDAHAQLLRAQPAATTVPSWYLGISGSVNFVRDAGVEGKGGTAPLRGTLEFDQGYGIAGALGYRTRNSGTIWDNIRFEAEVAGRENQLSQFIDRNGSVTPVNDNVSVQTAMANMYVDLDMGANWRPYLGVGLGGASVNVESANLGINDDDVVLAYQGMVGLYYTPTSFPAAEFGVGYRYLGTTNPKFTSSITGSRTEIEYESQNLEVGSRFYF